MPKIAEATAYAPTRPAACVCDIEKCSIIAGKTPEGISSDKTARHVIEAINNNDER